MSYQQESDLNASAHNISRACHCSQDKRHMPLRVCQGLWQLLTHLSCYSHPPIPTRPYALIHRRSEILERCHALPCLSGFSHSVLSEVPLLAPSQPLHPSPHWAREFSLTLQGSVYESRPWLRLSWHFTLRAVRAEYSLHITFVPAACL